VRNGRWSSFSIANQPVSFDSSQQSMPNRKMRLNCLWDDRRFVRHLGDVSEDVFAGAQRFARQGVMLGRGRGDRHGRKPRLREDRGPFKINWKTQ
jgi:hypothetical protein